MIEKYSKIDETFNVTRCDNGFMIEFSGRDGNDDYVNSDRKSTRLNSSHPSRSRMPSSA